ncbi:MAG: DUF1254 domain-containing protein [Thermodesulfobacteriota bacterium]|nr:DUF1254 domain-containing protein [Thermodesulfobacteriota bacterium]
MKGWKQDILAILILAVVVHLIALWAIPRLIEGMVEKGMLAKERCKLNAICCRDINVAGIDEIPMANPDSLFSRLVYDVSKEPLRIHLTVPDTGMYWSFSLYARNLDNYYVLNDRRLKSEYGSREMEIALVGPKSHYKKTSTNEVMVVSPSDRGTGLIRMIIADRYSAKGIEEIRELKKAQELSYTE